MHNVLTFFHRRQHMMATIIEWFHLLLADADEDIIRSKMEGLNKNLFVQVSHGSSLVQSSIHIKPVSFDLNLQQIFLCFFQFRKNRKLALRLISELAQESFAAGLTGEEQMILFNVVVENGAIERIKAIALYEVRKFTNFIATK